MKGATAIAWKPRIGGATPRTRNRESMMFSTQSTHKLLAGLSQASQILVQDAENSKLDRDVFNEAYLPFYRALFPRLEDIYLSADSMVQLASFSPPDMKEYALGAFLQALQEAAPLADAAVVLDQGRQHRRQALVEARQGVGRVVLQLAQIEPDLQHRAVGPDVGAAQVVDAQQLDVFFGAHGLGGVVQPDGLGLCVSEHHRG